MNAFYKFMSSDTCYFIIILCLYMLFVYHVYVRIKLFVHMTFIFYGCICMTVILCISCIFQTVDQDQCCIFNVWMTYFLGHRSQRLQWPIVITRCPASVRCLSSVVRRPLDYLHFQLLLQNRLMDFDETWYGWSTQGPLQVLLFFSQIRPGADPGRGKNRSRGSPPSRNFFFRPEGYSNKPNT